LAPAAILRPLTQDNFCHHSPEHPTAPSKHDSRPMASPNRLCSRLLPRSKIRQNQVTVQATDVVLVTAHHYNFGHPGPPARQTPIIRTFALAAKRRWPRSIKPRFQRQGDHRCGRRHQRLRQSGRRAHQRRVPRCGGVGDNPNATLALALFTGFPARIIQFSSPPIGTRERRQRDDHGNSHWRIRRHRHGSVLNHRGHSSSRTDYTPKVWQP